MTVFQARRSAQTLALVRGEGRKELRRLPEGGGACLGASCLRGMPRALPVGLSMTLEADSSGQGKGGWGEWGLRCP